MIMQHSMAVFGIIFIEDRIRKLNLRELKEWDVFLISCYKIENPLSCFIFIKIKQESGFVGIIS